ncbi:hypothetical protein MF271_14740 [Deinococcus sp. KNUC1210]|uniref:hypothetical protein n=1 Tax=Deinococcus sp. KNUC1210 TaxID=2917691 RepID=UPI001EEFEC5E|nr:hypothetical protein [Deinococcus sp. KNUC1210]ULH15195.1 hypothetical protein MF271_14740 [Deinococcus sp. KNUC1210]
MATGNAYPKLIFPNNFDELWKMEILSKEYFSLAKVVTEDGLIYPVFFISLYRLSQELTETSEKMQEYWFSEPGLIVLSEFTIDNMTNAVNSLWREKFFDKIQHESATA